MRARIKLDDPDPMRPVWLQAVLLLTTLLAGLWWSFSYLNESWTCTSQNSNCELMRRTLTCSGVALPTTAVLTSSEISLTLTCPSERGSTEVRICVLAATFGLTLQALYGVYTRGKRTVQQSTQVLSYMPLFLALVTLVDVLSIVAAEDKCDQLRAKLVAGNCWCSAAWCTALACGGSIPLLLLVRRGLRSWEALQPLDDL